MEQAGVANHTVQIRTKINEMEDFLVKAGNLKLICQT